MDYKYVEDFLHLGFGMFVHFGLYSCLEKGEWISTTVPELWNNREENYNKLMYEFNPDKDWAEKLVKVAKDGGCKYITLTTRHHEGFSLYDTCGLNDFDAVHGAAGRDLVREFVDACHKYDIVPFFYHTLLDWNVPEYQNDFPKYIDYLCDSLKILLTNYGKIGGLWFDGMWDKPDADWQEDRVYSLIKSIQPECMIINNTGLRKTGELGHPLIDSVTFERGKMSKVLKSERPRAGEACDSFTEHWGYCAEDINHKPLKELIPAIINARYYSGNYLLNVGPKPNGDVAPIEVELMKNIGKWINKNKGFIYNAFGTDIESSNGLVLKDDKYYYCVIDGMPMSANANVAANVSLKPITIKTDKKILNPVWLDSDEPAGFNEDGSIIPRPFTYGSAYIVRVLRFELGE